MFVEKPTSHNYHYFNFQAWKILNTKVKEVLKQLHTGRDDLTIAIANDTIFAQTVLDRPKVINIWLPNSLGCLHAQSYVNDKERHTWEITAMERIKTSKNALIGSVSNFVTDIFKKRFNLPVDKIINLHNGFYIPDITTFIRTDREVLEYLSGRGVPTDRDIIFCFGRADEYKGLDISLAAMLKISRSHHLLPVLIASKFSDESFIKDIQDRLRTMSRESRQETLLFFDYEFILPKYLLQHKRVKFLLNMPTKDFCPLIPFESEILGHENLSIINSDIDCLKWSITDMSDGFLCRPTSENIIRKVNDILNLPDSTKHAIIQEGKTRSLRCMNIEANYLFSLSHLSHSFI